MHKSPLDLFLYKQFISNQGFASKILIDDLLSTDPDSLNVPVIDTIDNLFKLFQIGVTGMGRNVAGVKHVLRGVVNEKGVELHSLLQGTDGVLKAEHLGSTFSSEPEGFR